MTKYMCRKAGRATAGWCVDDRRSPSGSLRVSPVFLRRHGPLLAPPARPSTSGSVAGPFRSHGCRTWLHLPARWSGRRVSRCHLVLVSACHAAKRDIAAHAVTAAGARLLQSRELAHDPGMTASVDTAPELAVFERVADDNRSTRSESWPVGFDPRFTRPAPSTSRSRVPSSRRFEHGWGARSNVHGSPPMTVLANAVTGHGLPLSPSCRAVSPSARATSEPVSHAQRRSRARAHNQMSTEPGQGQFLNRGRHDRQRVVSDS